MPTTPTIRFNLGPRSGAAQQLYVRAMLRRGILASSFAYLMLAHSEEACSRFLEACDESLGEVAALIEEAGSSDLPDARTAGTGFARLA